MTETFATLDIRESGSFLKRLRLAWNILLNSPLELGITKEEAKIIYEKYKEDFVFDGPKEVDPDWVKKQVLAMTADPAVDEEEIQKAMEAMEEKDAPVEIVRKPKPTRRKPSPARKKPTDSKSSTSAEKKPAAEKQPRGPRTRNTKNDN